MIYIQKDTNFIEIPRHGEVNTSHFKLQLLNSLTQTSYLIDNVDDISYQTLIFKFDLTDFSEDIRLLPEGEYKFALVDEQENLYEVGLITIGDYKQVNKNYHTNKKIVQYNG